MAEWLYEAGIGEARAALVDQGRIVEMAVEPDDAVLRAGSIVEARLLRRPDAAGRALAGLADGGEALLTAPPPGLTEGTRLIVEVVREALSEAGGTKPAHVRAAAAGTTPAPGPDLATRIAATGYPVRRLAQGADLFEAHGWSALLEEAAGGIVARPQALLRVSLTPAITLIDVDGAGSAAALALAGAALAGETIRLFDIAGSIGIDLPTMTGKADRQAAANALDAALPPPFERTAVNGFGFLQIVRRRTRPSLVERLAADPIGAAALALLRRGERASGHGALTLTAAPLVIRRLEARRDWLAALAARIGAPVILSPAPAVAISGGHGQRLHT